MPRFSEFLSRPRHDDSPHDDIDRSRRALIGAGGALMLGAALWPLRARAATDGKLHIGVIGSGHIGGTIGGLWVKAGHPVLFSSRHPEELKDLVAGLGPLAQAGTVEQAIAFGDVLFIAVPYGALPQIGQDYGAALKGKIVLDACNAVAARDGAIAEEVEHERHRRNLAEISARHAAGARLQHAELHDLRAARRTAPIPSSRSRSPATMPRRCKSRPGWCATPASIRWWSASSPMRAASSAARRATASR